MKNQKWILLSIAILGLTEPSVQAKNKSEDVVSTTTIDTISIKNINEINEFHKELKNALHYLKKVMPNKLTSHQKEDLKQIETLLTKLNKFNTKAKYKTLSKKELKESEDIILGIIALFILGDFIWL